MSDTSVDAALSPETDPVAAESDTPGERMADPRVFPVPIRMAFQAIVDGTTGKVVMHEALARAPNGKSAAPILREITPDNRRDFDQKCQGAAITLAHRLGVSVPVMINILPDAITEPESDLGLSRDVASPIDLAQLLEERLAQNTGWDIRTTPSGIVCLTTAERSRALRAMGKLPCPRCIQWCKGEKGQNLFCRLYLLEVMYSYWVSKS